MSMDNLKIAIEESVKETFGDNAKYILRNWEFRQEFRLHHLGRGKSVLHEVPHLLRSTH